MPIWLNMPLLHAGQPEPTGWLHSNWTPEPTILVGGLVLIALYVLWTGSRNRNEQDEPIHPVSTKERVLFIAGVLTFMIALNPPLDDWSDHFLLSAHMLQHLLLMIVAVPLMILGTPPFLVSKLVARKPVRTVLYSLTRPIPAFVIGNLIIVVWHMPFAYDEALGNLQIHIAQHMCFMLAGFLVWWPVLSRSPELPGLSPPLACLYLFVNSIPGSIVGAFLTFAGAGVYTVYPDAQRIFGLDLEMDQQIAGLTMWVLTGTVYLGWVTVIFLRWAAAEERADRPPPSRSTSPAPTQ